MSVIEQITKMKNQGMPTGQIIFSLKSQGYSPKEINEALSQSEIKSELTKYPENFPRPTYKNHPSDLQPSMDTRTLATQQPTQEEPQDQEETSREETSYLNVPQEFEQSPQTFEQPYQTPEQLPPVSPYQEYQGYPEQQLTEPQDQQEYSQQYYPEYTSPQTIDFEAVSDLTNQIIEEKMMKTKKEILSLIKSKKAISEDIKRINNRIDKIENTLNELQLAIIKKVGEYGEDIKTISDELKATQDSFSKMVNPIVDNIRDSEPHKTKNKKNKEFEDYLR
ncbi:hypothetical protein J4221_04285 [Candidatus Pacearchaeota archaeon]|nr:hypothetical protein [Candidatus Pacearchaeota archaeon]